MQLSRAMTGSVVSVTKAHTNVHSLSVTSEAVLILVEEN